MTPTTTLIAVSRTRCCALVHNVCRQRATILLCWLCAWTALGVCALYIASTGAGGGFVGEVFTLTRRSKHGAGVQQQQQHSPPAPRAIADDDDDEERRDSSSSAAADLMPSSAPFVSADMFVENRRRLLSALRARLITGADSDGGGAVVVLQGGRKRLRYNTDAGEPFRQESNFRWLFGATEPGCYGALDVDTGHAMLLVPKQSDAHAVWVGPAFTDGWYRERFGQDLSIEFVVGADEPDFDGAGVVVAIEAKFSHAKRLLLLRKVLKDFLRKSTALAGVLVGIGQNSRSNESRASGWPATLPASSTTTTTKSDDEAPPPPRLQTDVSILEPELVALRVRKSAHELNALRYAALVGTNAHILFHHQTAFEGGCRREAYGSVVGCGRNGALLHYMANDERIDAGALCVMDMGPDCAGFISDVTITVPANGHFSADQRAVYETVLRANRAVFAALRPGVFWWSMQQLAGRIILEGLRQAGVLRADADLGEMQRVGLVRVFMPHGLGHFIGLDVHDVGTDLFEGKPPPAQFKRSRKIAHSRIHRNRALKKTVLPIQAGLVITIEPGCYFNDMLLDRALADREQSVFINASRLAAFRGMGGVRIEDCKMRVVNRVISSDS